MPFSPLRTDDPFLSHLQAALKQAFDELQPRAQVLKDVRLSTTPARLYHALGRQIVGWRITRKNDQADVWESAGADASSLTLTASAPVTVTIEVW